MVDFIRGELNHAAAIMVDFIRGELNHAILDNDGKLMHIVPMWGTLGQFFQPIDMITNSEGVTFVIEWRGDRSTTLGQATLTQVCYTGAVPSVTAACKADKVAGTTTLGQATLTQVWYTGAVPSVTAACKADKQVWYTGAVPSVTAACKADKWRGDRTTTVGEATLTRYCYTSAAPSVTAACKADKVAAFEADQVAGLAPLSVSVTSAGSFHSQGARLAYEWDFGDGSVMELTPDASHTFTAPATYRVLLTTTAVSNSTLTDHASHIFTAPGNYRVLLTTTAVSDSTMTDQCAIDVSVGNSAPTVVINAPAWDAGFYCSGSKLEFSVVINAPAWDAGFYCSGSKLDFNVDAFDAEDGNTNDGSIGCDQLLVSYYVGHDAHFHPSGAYTSCRGGQTVDMAGHSLLADDIYWGIELQYKDKGNVPAKPTTSRTSILAYNRMIQAEDYTGHSDATCAKYPKLQKDGCSMTAKSEGGLLAQGPKGGGWMKYGPYNPFNLKQVSVRFTALQSTVTLQLRAHSVSVRFTAVKSTVTLQLRGHSPTGPILAVWRLPSTASDVSNIIYNDTFKEATTGFADPNQTLTLDLGSTKSVGKIVLVAPARSNCPAGYAIYGKASSGNYQLPLTPLTRSTDFNFMQERVTFEVRGMPTQNLNYRHDSGNCFCPIWLPLTGCDELNIVQDSSAQKTEVRRLPPPHADSTDSSGNYQLPVTPFTRSKTPSCDTAGQTTIAFSGSARYLVIVQTGNSDSAWAVAEARVYAHTRKRYLVIVQTGNGNSAWAVAEARVYVAEGRVYAPDGTSIKVNGAKALYNKDAAYKAVDGNTGTNWSTLIKQIGGPFSLYLTPTGTSTWFANWFEFSNGAGVSSSSTCTAYANCGKYNQCNNSCGDGSLRHLHELHRLSPAAAALPLPPPPPPLPLPPPPLQVTTSVCALLLPVSSAAGRSGTRPTAAAPRSADRRAETAAAPLSLGKRRGSSAWMATTMRSSSSSSSSGAQTRAVSSA
ncbi:hypothetical protein JKP88DRAFT_308080 [Tribonema minus]|uniref:PKD domain-containing protein n=1 Tax=Tribonema minus TaxID=303371 RepID=A0A836CIC6_9STRA|nr:hypothetical protein JKP88DRAFT_308080 [Tribonema minus]